MNTEVATKREFLPGDLTISSWEDIKPWLDKLSSWEFDSIDDFKNWLKARSEVEAFIEEDAAWRYIKMTIDTADEDLASSYQFFITEIQPKLSPIFNELNLKMIQSGYLDQFDDEAYKIFFKKIRSEIDLFREVNIPIHTDVQKLAQEYGAIIGGLDIEVDGKKLTLPAAAAELQSTDRNHREKVWKLTHDARLTSRDKLDEIYSDLVSKRHEIASNAGFKNYRDYKFEELGRFDYTPEDCFTFHESIASEIVPLVGEFLKNRKDKLGVDNLRPWDLAVDPTGKAALKPFKKADDLLNRSVSVFSKVDPYCGTCLSTMDEMGYLDLASKPGKAPGGYNYPLYESGVPFIFMNAVGTQRDMVTMMHEGGHAVHSFLTQELELTSFKSCPSEVAELASMAMELLSMDYWDEFYSSEEELNRAKKDHLQDLISILPWIAIIDKFQHWVYENPTHSKEERYAEWLKIYNEFTADVIDYSGVESAKEIMWHKQLHLFEVPFYYIEYAMAQLGAIAVWRNYKTDPAKAIQQYKEALSLGYTKSIGGIYKAAGIEFNFSREYVRELVEFVKGEIEAIG